MISLTDEMADLINNNLEKGVPCMLATASLKGEPSIGYRGSMMVFDGEHLAWWERTKRGALAHIRENPKGVVVAFRDPPTRTAWKFYGEAKVYQDGDIRGQVMSRVVERELRADPDRNGFAIVMRVDRVENWRGEVLQKRGE